MQGRLFLDVVVRQSSSIFKLLSREDQSLLIWGDSFLILDFSLHIVDRIRWFHFQCDGLSGQSFHKNLHATS